MPIGKVKSVAGQTHDGDERLHRAALRLRRRVAGLPQRTVRMLLRCHGFLFLLKFFFVLTRLARGWPWCGHCASTPIPPARLLISGQLFSRCRQYCTTSMAPIFLASNGNCLHSVPTRPRSASSSTAVDCAGDMVCGVFGGRAHVHNVIELMQFYYGCHPWIFH